jgi:AraC-like DNA-binding protein
MSNLLESDSGIALLASEHICPCAVRWEGYFSDYYALQLTIGSIELHYGSRNFHLDGAWYWCGVPGPHVRFWPAEGTEFWDHRYITFRGPLAKRWAALGLIPMNPQRAPEDAPAQFDLLLQLARRSDEWGRRRAVNLLEQIFLGLADSRSQPVAPPSWLEPALQALTSGDFAPNYGRLAGEHGMSLSSLRQQFKQHMGMTLHNYVLQSRLSQARSLLTETNTPLKEIAEQLGYGDIYYFSRQFHQLTGITASDYRKHSLAFSAQRKQSAE